MRISQKWLLFFIPLIFWFIVNELNISYSRSINKTYYGYIHKNPDTRGYTDQIKNWAAGNGFTFDPKNDPEMAVRRTPGYTLFYGLHYVLFGEEGSYQMIRYTQLFLFAWSCCLLFGVVYRFSGNKKWASWAAWLYAFSPFIPFYSYYIVTESVSSFLVILILFVYSKYWETKERKYLYVTGLVIAALFLSRPLMGILLPAIFISIVNFRKLLDKEYFQKKIIDGIVYTFGFATLVAPWVIRNYVVTGGDIVLAEKFYHGAPMNFGRGHIQFRTLNSGWTNTGSGVTELFAHHLKYNSAEKDSEENAKKIITDYKNNLPPSVLQTLDKKEFDTFLWDMYHCYWATAQFQKENPTANRVQWINLPCQDEIKAKATLFTEQYKNANVFRYYVTQPSKSIVQVMTQSNTHHIFPLNPKDRNFSFWQKAAKGICLFLNISLFFSLFIFIFAPKAPLNLKVVFSLSLFAILFVLVWLVRHLENRYLIPFLPMAYIALAFWLTTITTSLKKHFGKPSDTI